MNAGLSAGLAREASRRLRRASVRRQLPAEALSSGPLRCWLAAIEDALAIERDAKALLGMPARSRRICVRWPRLIDRVADEGVLAELAPGGRVPDDLPRRALRYALHSLGSLHCDLPSVLARFAVAHQNPAPEVTRVLVEWGLDIVEGRRDRGFEARVGRAMACLDAAWPEGAAMIRGRTWRIVPVTAWATVSYSSAKSPGIAYINVNSAPLVRLAEDLIHETTHMRLHEIEALHALIAGSAREADGNEPRFYSPWRHEWRPLRGLVHAACTFTAGAMFFERMLSASEPRSGAVRIADSRRRWLARRLLEERASVAMALTILRWAARQGLLTAAGRRVVATVRREHRALAGKAVARKRWLRGSAKGRVVLGRFDRFLRSLRGRPLRFG